MINEKTSLLRDALRKYYTETNTWDDAWLLFLNDLQKLLRQEYKVDYDILSLPKVSCDSLFDIPRLISTSAGVAWHREVITDDEEAALTAYANKLRERGKITTKFSSTCPSCHGDSDNGCNYCNSGGL